MSRRVRSIEPMRSVPHRKVMSQRKTKKALTMATQMKTVTRRRRRKDHLKTKSRPSTRRVSLMVMIEPCLASCEAFGLR